MCYFCNGKHDIYIKCKVYAKSMLAPLTRAEEIRQQLEDMTGERYARLEYNFCPLCGERIEG